MNKITILLNRWANEEQTNSGQQVEAELIEELYPKIHQIAQQHLNRNIRSNGMQTTEVVNEAFIKLKEQQHVDWKNRNHFLAISSVIIRRIVVDHFRSVNSSKRGGKEPHLTIERVSSVVVGELDVNIDWLELHDLINELETIDPSCAKLIELRFFGGLTLQETASVCNISISSVTRSWRFAKNWLLTQLTA